MSSLDRWKHCVVNVEFGQFDTEIENRRSGTAIFIHYKEKFFLVTAAHLIIDPGIRSDEPLYHRIFKQMFRVPLLSELNDENKRKIITKNIYFNDKGDPYLQKTRDNRPYEHEGKDIAAPKFIPLSESYEPEDSAVTILEDLDLAVISLRMRLNEMFLRTFLNDPLFVEELLLLEYQPLSFNEIKDEPSQEGSDIFTVGYPSHVSQVGKRDEIIGKFEKMFSNDISLPCFTFGKVSMVSSDLSYFWGDLRVYLGNSGCPVIEGNKLVGIVTHDAVIEEKDKLNNVPFAKATKAKFLSSLLDSQIKKDEIFANPETLHIRFPNMFASPEKIAETEKMIKSPKERKCANKTKKP